MLLRSATLADGRVVDVRVRGELIESIGAPGGAAEPGETVFDLAGHLLVPALVEPHAHLDKAFLSERIPNPTGDLMGAIIAMSTSRHLITLEDTIERAERAVRLMVANGTTLIRSHADTTHENGLTSVLALAEVRRRVADVCDVQIVALVSWPVAGVAGADSRALLRDALHAGADVVGGCPHLEADADAAGEALLSIAAEFARPVDLHTDEHLDEQRLSIEDLARHVVETGFPHLVTASHCVSLGMQSAERQRAVAEAIARAAISVVALPQTNLFLQGRQFPTGMPRALTAVDALRRAGVNVCAGADNLQDPFNPMGRGDPLETAGLMVTAGHMLPADAMHAVSGAARAALTGATSPIEPGASAELVAVPSATVREAIAFAPGQRIVFHRGRVVSGSPTSHETNC